MKRRLALFGVLVLVLAIGWTVAAQAACNHQYGNPVILDNDYHQLTCTICGHKIKQRHGAVCTGVPGVCDVCHATSVNTELFHNHKTYTCDTIYHTQVCADCGTVLIAPEYHTVNEYGMCIVCQETGLSQKVTRLTVDEEADGVELLVGSGAMPTHTLTTIIEPANAADKTLNFTSSNVKVAKVGADGVITAVDFGSCIVTVSTTDGSGHVCRVRVTVKQKMIEEITIDPDTALMQIGGATILTANIEPADAYDTSFKWVSSNPRIAEVDEYGVVDAISVGTCYIYANAQDGSGVQGRCKVTVHSGAVTAITLNSYSKTLKLKDGETVTFQIIPTVYPADASDQDVLYASSNPAVATVTDTGLVTAVSPGTATIRVSAHDGFGAVAEMTVKVKKVLVTSIKLSESTLNMTITGGVMPVAALSCQVYPASATDQTVTWSSSNDSVAEVDEDGVVTAVGAGVCTITCTANDGGGAYATCLVTIINNPVKLITLNMDSVTLHLRDGVAMTAQLYATVYPTDAAIQTVKYYSSDKKVATVNSKGMITAISPGTCRITAKAKDGSEVKAYCQVTVTSGGIDSITLNVKTKVLEMTTENPNPSFQLIATIKPDEAAGTPLVWESSDESVAFVSDTGLVTAIGPGTCTITASSDDGTASDSMQVTVRKPSTAQIKLNYTSKTVIWDPKKIQTVQLKAKVTPTDAYDRRIVWESDNENVASVSASGLVTIRNLGKAVITAKTTDGSNLQASCVIHVIYKQITSLTLNANKKELILKYKKTVTAQLRAIIKPANAGYKVLKWSSSNEDVATVSETGLVTAVAPGTVIITARAQDGSKLKATCVVTVKAILVASIKVKQTSITMEIGEVSQTYQIKPTIAPKNASNPELEYYSSNEGVARVDENGLIQAISYGTCTVTVTAKDGGGATATITVTVK